MSRTPQKTLLCLKLLIPFCLIWSTILYFYRFPFQKPVPDQTYLYDTASQDNKANWIKQALESEVDGNFDSSSITALCGTKTWLPGLVITCDITEKSIADIRNVFLNCLRYSIEAGATGLVIPDALPHLFDIGHFTASLAQSCPHLVIHTSSPVPPSSLHLIRVSPEGLSRKFLPGADTVLAHPQDWAPSFHSHIDSKSPPFNATTPLIVKLTNPRYQFPLSYDSSNFVSSFGRLLHWTNPSIRKSAAAITYAMSMQQSFVYDPTVRYIQHETFLGARLQGSPSQTPPEQQAKYYLHLAATQNFSTLYLASASPYHLRYFKDHASSYPLSVGGSIKIVEKFSLLSSQFFAADLAALQALSAEEQECVEYEVLLRSSIFTSVFENIEVGAWAWGIAMRRHGTILRGWDGSGNGEVGVGGQVIHGNLENHAFFDRYSVLYKGDGWKDEVNGRESRILGASMWP